MILPSVGHLAMSGDILTFLIDLFLAALGLRGCAQAFSSCRGQGLLSSGSAEASHGGGVSCRGARAQLPCSMRNLPGTGVRPLHRQADS